jgi:hypothetical protein
VLQVEAKTFSAEFNLSSLRGTRQKHLVNGRDGPLDRPFASARPAVAPYQNFGFLICEMAFRGAVAELDELLGRAWPLESELVSVWRWALPWRWALRLPWLLLWPLQSV